MSLIYLYINDGGDIRRIGDDPHDMLMIWKGKLWYHNLQNGDGCRLGEESEWYSFVENADEYGYNCDPRKTENSSEIPNNCEDEPQTCNTCKRGEWYRHGYDITMMDDECGGCCSWNSKWTPKTEPTISKMEQVPSCIACEDCHGNSGYERKESER